jgi:hypothetical protein
MTGTFRCLVGRHQWCEVTIAGGYDADCWACGKHRRVKARDVHRSAKAQYDAARARDEAFASRDSFVFVSGIVIASQREAGPIGSSSVPRRRRRAPNRS